MYQLGLKELKKYGEEEKRKLARKMDFAPKKLA
jgi:hypothetical protein